VVVGLASALAAAVVFGSSSILQAVGSRRTPTAHRLDTRLLVRLLRQRLFVAAVVLNLVGFLLHLVALRLLPLFLAQAGIAAGLAVTALLAVRIFHERLGPAQWWSVAGVCVGLALLTAAAGTTGTERATGGLSIALVVGVGAVGVVGAALSRGRGPAVTASLSVFAGLGFATTALCARLLPELSASSILSSPVAYLLPVAGALAFLLYSLALQRGDVTAATAPMVVLQTFTPAVVGVVALGDEIRTGWLFGAVLGLLLTIAGAVTLTRSEAQRGAEDSRRKARP